MKDSKLEVTYVEDEATILLQRDLNFVWNELDIVKRERDRLSHICQDLGLGF